MPRLPPVISATLPVKTPRIHPPLARIFLPFPRLTLKAIARYLLYGSLPAMRIDLPHGYWNPKIELMPKDKLRQLQLKRLREAIRYAWENSPFYRNLMAK